MNDPTILKGPAYEFNGDVYRSREEAMKAQRSLYWWRATRCGFYIGLAIGWIFGLALPQIIW
jgi:hypothetical protein